MTNVRQTARIFKVLSVETRVRILEILKSDCLCVGELARRLGVSPAAVSQHLRILRDAGIVEPEKRGCHVHYLVSYEALKRIRELALDLAKPSGLKELDPVTEKKSETRKEMFMCDCKNGCQKPENLKTQPEECSPGQIKKCHGDDKNHPCAPEDQDE